MDTSILAIFTPPGGAFWGWSLIQDPESLLLVLWNWVLVFEGKLIRFFPEITK